MSNHTMSLTDYIALIAIIVAVALFGSIAAALIFFGGLACFLIFLVMDEPKQRALNAWIADLERKGDWGV